MLTSTRSTFLAQANAAYVHVQSSEPPVTHRPRRLPPPQITIIQGVLSDINTKKGESECRYYIDKLDYLDERQRDPVIDQCTSLLCHGELRNKSGTVSRQDDTLGAKLRALG